MLIFTILKIILCSWILLLIVQSISHDVISLVIISGTIITSIPVVLFLSMAAGFTVFRTVFLFSLFVIVVITLHLIQLVLG
ncbi:MAG: hypothetical protein ACFFDJ_07820 [Candidatus Odinarchaeota archaeon]